MKRTTTICLLALLLTTPLAVATSVTVEPRDEEVYTNAYVEPLGHTLSAETTVNTTTLTTTTTIGTPPLLP